QNHWRQRMTRVDSMLTAGRIVVLGIFCTLLLQGCSLWDKRDRAMVCGVRGGVSVPIWAGLDVQQNEGIKMADNLPDGIVAPGGCWTTAVLNPQSGSGWLELDATTGQPTGN